jgi:DNA-binding XRE family transcriptional regulator
VREVAGLSQRDVADALGVGEHTVHRWETGQSRPQFDSAVRYGMLLRALAEPAYTLGGHRGTVPDIEGDHA